MSWLLAALLFAGSQPIAMEGLVLDVSAERGSITVSHKEVPGVMPAMAMPLRVRDAALLRRIQRGMIVTFDLVNGEARGIRVRRPENFIEQDGRRVPLPAPREKVPIGSLLPDLLFTDHHGRAVRLDQFRGRVVAVQFLYTRCPMPEVCPRLAATFAAVQRRFLSRMGKDIELLSVTLDPRYDTAAELSRYAGMWRAGESWQFLTGSEDQIKSAAACFGLVYWPEEGVITHTSTIGIIGRDGRLAALVEGLSFTARQLGDLIERVADKESKR